MLLFDSDILITRAFFGERIWGRARRPTVYFAVVESIAAKQCVAFGEVLVYANLNEVLVSRLHAREKIFSSAAAKVVAVRVRKQLVHKYCRLRIHRERRLTRQDPLSRVIIRDRCESGNPQPLNKRFISGKEKCLFLAKPASECAAKLVTLEGRYGTGLAIKVVLSVQR